MNFIKRLFGSGKPAFRAESADRRTVDVATAITPRRITAIFRAANGGDVEDQCLLSRELLEHNATIAQAVFTRVQAVKACAWDIKPADETPDAKQAADALKAELLAIRPGAGVETFPAAVDHLMGALLPGFAVCEILWRDGGHVGGFSPVESRFFTFRDGFLPRLVTNQTPLGMELPARRVLYHTVRFHGGDPARGGLIRPLAWMHCFANLTDKNLLAFVERYGMPFLFAKTNTETYREEVRNLQHVVENLGSSYGGVFSSGTELNFVQPPSVTGDVYFRLKENLDNAVTRLILGQTASSGDGGGLSGDNAQDKVRRDILKGDCSAIEDTVNAQLCVPWASYNLPAGAPAPRFEIDCCESENLLQTAQTVQALAAAGFKADAAELSERFGLTLTYEPPAAQNGMDAFGMGANAGNTAPEPDADVAHTLNLKQKYDAMGVAIRAGLLTATPEIEAQTRAELNLPAMTPEVEKAWNATGGIRQPITLKTAESAAVEEALNVDTPTESAAMSDSSAAPGKPVSGELKTDLADALEEWLGPVADAVGEQLDGECDDAEFAARLKKLASVNPGDSGKFENLMTADMRKAWRGGELKNKK